MEPTPKEPAEGGSTESTKRGEPNQGEIDRSHNIKPHNVKPTSEDEIKNKSLLQTSRVTESPENIPLPGEEETSELQSPPPTEQPVPPEDSSKLEVIYSSETYGRAEDKERRESTEDDKHEKHEESKPAKIKEKLDRTFGTLKVSYLLFNLFTLFRV